MQSFSLKVITIERNKELQESLKQQANSFGIKRLEFVFGKSLSKSESIKNLAKVVYERHEELIRNILTSEDQEDVMICEDDVDFMTKKGFERVVEIHNRLKQTGRQWSILLVGHVMALPGLPSDVNDVILSPFSWASHCYLINRKAGFFLDFPSSRFTRPHLIEGWQALPLQQRLACFPSLATQRGGMSKEVRNVPLIRDIPFELLMHCTNTLVYVVSLALFILLLLLVSRIC